jgi:hypothetical protein
MFHPQALAEFIQEAPISSDEFYYFDEAQLLLESALLIPLTSSSMVEHFQNLYTESKRHFLMGSVERLMRLGEI